MRGHTLFFAAVAAAAIFMTLPVSRPVWETLTILQVAEFPWRMLGLANLGLAFLAGGAVLLAPPKIRWPVTAACLVAQLVAVAPYLYPVIPFTRYGAVTLADQIDYERRSQSIGTTTLGEYLPRTVGRPPHSSPLVSSFQAGLNPERLDRESLPKDATATLLRQTAVSHRYRLDSPTAFSLRLFQFDYPGWQATISNGYTNTLEVNAEPETGLILVDVPAGRHTLTVYFGQTPGRAAAMALSGLAALGLILLVVLRRPATIQSALPATPPLRLASPVVLLLAGLIIVTALVLKPLLRPLFTLQSPPGRALPARHDTAIAFDNGLRLIGYDLSRKVVPAGGYLQMTLYWETDVAPLKTNLQPFVHLDRLDDFTTVADATNYTPGDPTTESVVPTFHWDTERYVRDEHDFILPAGLPPRRLRGAGRSHRSRHGPPGSPGGRQRRHSMVGYR